MDNEKMTACETCGAEIAASAKTCPHCGAKNKVKKPVYKRWWFWVLIVVVVIALMPDTRTETKTTPQSFAQNEIPRKDTADTPEPAETSSVQGLETEIPGIWTAAQKNVMASAKSYLNYSGFSYDGLVRQLEFEKYSHEDAVWAADNCNADWNEEALESAKSYINYSGFSYKGLIGQLKYEGFTDEQATYGAENCGADWNEEAAESAESYLNYSSFSRQGLIDQLLYEGFTQEQAEYGVSQNGY